MICDSVNIFRCADILSIVGEMCVKVLNKACVCACLRTRGKWGVMEMESVRVCDLVSLRDSLQRTVMTGGIREATQTRENSLLSSPLLSSPYYHPHLKTFSYVTGYNASERSRLFWFYGRAPGVNNPSMDIWDGGRETEKGTHLDRD